MAVDGLGKPTKIFLSPGQDHDVTKAPELIRDSEADKVIADKAYDSDALIAQIDRKGHGTHKELKAGQEPPSPTCAPGRVPRVTRLMALAIRLDGLLRTGQLSSYVEIAQLGHISRAP